MGVTQWHDLPGSMTPGAPYSAGHEVRSHRYESLEERQRESRSTDPQELLDLEVAGAQRRGRGCEPGLEATRLTAIELGMPQGFVERVVNGSILAGAPKKGSGDGDASQLSARVIRRHEAHLSRLVRRNW